MSASTETEKPESKEINPAVAFRRTAVNMASSLLKDWVGEERAREAIGRIAAAISSSAAAARDPKEFYECTPQSVATCVAVAALTGIMPSTGASALAYVFPQSPRKGERKQLSYSLSHRGCNALARRCGQTMIPIPIGRTDVIESDEHGEIKIVSRDIDNPPTTYEELRGVLLIVKQLDTGLVVTRGWVPKKLIDARRAVSKSFNGDYPQYSPWTVWPVEQAMKTAMHYAIGRGWCVVDDTEAVRALSADAESDFDSRTIDASAPVVVSDMDALAKELVAKQAGIKAIEHQSEPEKFEVKGCSKQEEPVPVANRAQAGNPAQQEIPDVVEDFRRQVAGCEDLTDLQLIESAVKRSQSLVQTEKVSIKRFIDARRSQMSESA